MKLQNILVKDRLALTNILDEIKNNKIMDAKAILTLHVVNLVALMNYPPTVKDITAMSEAKVKKMTKIMNNNPLTKIKETDKMEEFVRECLRLLSIDDSNQSTRKVALESYFNDMFSF